GPIYVDAQVIIYGVQRDPRYAAALAPLWAAQAGASHVLVTSQLSVMERLILPLRIRDATLISDFERTFKLPGLRVAPIDETILRSGAQLRADYKSLRTPDAIHAATCLSMS